MFPTNFVVTFFITVLFPSSSLYCCHCLQPWQQPKTFQGLQQVNIPLDDHCKPDLQCVMLDLDLGQDTSRPPHSMSQTITMHGCSLCWRQPLSLQPCHGLHKLSHNMFPLWFVFAQWNSRPNLKGEPGCRSYLRQCVNIRFQIIRLRWNGTESPKLFSIFTFLIAKNVCLPWFFMIASMWIAWGCSRLICYLWDIYLKHVWLCLCQTRWEQDSKCLNELNTRSCRIWQIESLMSLRAAEMSVVFLFWPYV